MLIPTTRAPGILSPSLLRSLAPCVSSLCSRLPELRKPKILDASQTASGSHSALPFKKVSYFPSRLTSADYSDVSPKILGLLGMGNTEKIVGPSVLRYVTIRDFSTTGATRADGAASSKTSLIEPFGAIFKFLEPEFLKAKLFKIDQKDAAIFFSYGKNQYLSVSCYVGTNGLESVAIIFGNEGGSAFGMHDLMKQIDPVACAKNGSDLNAISEKYRLNDKNAPQALREVGARLYSITMLRQVINFMENHKKALTEVYLDEFRF